MVTQIALLRGVNVGGKNKVPMGALRTVVESLGCANVRTYIQSGNVIFRASKAVAPATLEAAIAREFGVEIVVVVRTAAGLGKAVHANPFPDADPATLHVGFLAQKPAAAAMASLHGDPFLPEEFAVRGKELYLHLPNGMGRAKLPAYLDRRLKVPTTVRNWNTVTKLVELAAS